MNLMMTLSLFSALAIGRIPAYLLAKAKQTDRKGQGEIQVANTFYSIREIFRGLENGDGAASFERVTDDVDWTVMGTHLLAGHYPIKKAFFEGRFGKLNQVVRRVRAFSWSAWAISLLLTCCPLSAQNKEHPVRNVVLVHGAWADGSGWRGVYDILVKDGYQVSIVQEPLTSFQDDVAATRRILALQDGPCILVAHSYGGSVITEAGTDRSVVGLVYIAAHMPDAGESEAGDGKRFPSDLSKSTAIRKTADGFDYLDPAQFREYFAADLSLGQATFESRSQVLIADGNFKTLISIPAWRSKPSWVAVATKDRTINPDLERWYATRAHSHKIEVVGASHSVYTSRPKDVAALIEDAATHAR
jgi:pimeloyl-ACP methyl ester carboxylesterase